MGTEYTGLGRGHALRILLHGCPPPDLCFYDAAVAAADSAGIGLHVHIEMQSQALKLPEFNNNVRNSRPGPWQKGNHSESSVLALLRETDVDKHRTRAWESGLGKLLTSPSQTWPVLQLEEHLPAPFTGEGSRMDEGAQMFQRKFHVRCQMLFQPLPWGKAGSRGEKSHPPTCR